MRKHQPNSLRRTQQQQHEEQQHDTNTPNQSLILNPTRSPQPATVRSPPYYNPHHRRSCALRPPLPSPRRRHSTPGRRWKSVLSMLPSLSPCRSTKILLGLHAPQWCVRDAHTVSTGAPTAAHHMDSTRAGTPTGTARHARAARRVLTPRSLQTDRPSPC